MIITRQSPAQSVWLTGEETTTISNKHEDKNTQFNTDSTGDVNQQISHQTSPDDYWHIYKIKHIVNVHLNIQMRRNLIRTVQNRTEPWTLDEIRLKVLVSCCRHVRVKSLDRVNLDIYFYHSINQKILSTTKKTINIFHVIRNKVFYRSGCDRYINNALCTNLQNNDRKKTGHLRVCESCWRDFCLKDWEKTWYIYYEAGDNRYQHESPPVHYFYQHN